MFKSNIVPNFTRYKASKSEWPWLEPFKVKYDSAIELPIYGFLLLFYRNVWPNSATLQDIRLWNVRDLEFDLSRSLKVKCDSVTGLPICYY